MPPPTAALTVEPLKPDDPGPNGTRANFHLRYPGLSRGLQGTLKHAILGGVAIDGQTWYSGWTPQNNANLRRGVDAGSNRRAAGAAGTPPSRQLGPLRPLRATAMSTATATRTRPTRPELPGHGHQASDGAPAQGVHGRKRRPQGNKRCRPLIAMFRQTSAIANVRQTRHP